jgi:hypothetical protein
MLILMANLTPDALEGGGFLFLLGVLCFVFNRTLGRWFRLFPRVVWGMQEEAGIDDVIYRGLACAGGLLCAGFGLMLLADALR